MNTAREFESNAQEEKCGRLRAELCERVAQSVEERLREARENEFLLGAGGCRAIISESVVRVRVRVHEFRSAIARRGAGGGARRRVARETSAALDKVLKRRANVRIEHQFSHVSAQLLQCTASFHQTVSWHSPTLYA